LVVVLHIRRVVYQAFVIVPVGENKLLLSVLEMRQSCPLLPYAFVANIVRASGRSTCARSLVVANDRNARGLSRSRTRLGPFAVAAWADGTNRVTPPCGLWSAESGHRIP